MGVDDSKASQDWAIVIGIRFYPGFSDLDGPENDAKSFHEWLTSPVGGSVPVSQTRLILSADYHPPLPNGATHAKPTVQLIQEAFDELFDRSQKNDDDGRGFRVGRRLYIYLAGHGFEPQPEHVALLAANATRNRAGYHIAGKLYADVVRYAGLFDEVVLFMDCCREWYSRVPLNLPPYVSMPSGNAPENGRWFTCYATKWSRKSREKMIGGERRGVFTTALLKGLCGAAANEVGEVTAGSLADYLHAHMKDLLTKEELDDPEIPKLPEVNCNHESRSGMVIARVPPPRYVTEIVVPASAQGKYLTVLDRDFHSVLQRQVQADPIVVELSRGFYLAQILPDGLRKAFEVYGVEQGGTVRIVLET